MTTEIAIPEVASAVAGLYSSDPAQMVAQAQAQATVLADIINNRNLYTMISGKKHVSVEGWTTLGAMLGVFPVVVWTKELVDDDGKQLGWEARVEARTLAGQVVGAADAECRRTERTWRSRDSYAIRSMAQTRATSKALRLPLGFIMAIAGYEATPTEERNLGAINQAKTEVLAMVDGDKAEAASLWAAALEDHELASDADVTAEHIESIIEYVRNAVDITDAEVEDE